ncbi:ubiquinol cytochrome c oxidoreductase, cytochrome b subunit [Sulfurimonas gotlandica GD1]|uniref:Ubiquinol cytochrome c oxidoreductase, cytochrome b subunit n=1 Tax=Sulfurimonas gotlandica (strain DSM 19862 / JCM 16533 / GD1) TaxID=929558 RepID=B6BHR9_SULGG|nr:cytochrome bc complex cytochrome b subunit [Sulfurimonas gotlandica]EDZ63525.1 ubiquinol Cytochrome c oxidoreductase,cytochrome b subunit [Sulfurimonas gotlandica GD1]EHP30070.1 ubiquinol cytochrome c oxidoreductase, cytochrome b subunit [Sulfurimonas gotlandica GD1]
MAHFTKATSVKDWLNQRLAIEKVEKVMASEYWIPKNINFLWAMGMVLVITFVLLLVSGIFLLMYYQPSVGMAFDSVNYTIMREVGFGWLWRHVHGVAASVVFLIIYIHMFTGIYYGSYKKGREMIWISGMLLFIAFSTEAFSGYMLPWGQMSYWAGMVITNLFSGGSLHADGLVEWIRGDYVPAQAFLTRFFMLHVLLVPIAIMGLIGLHFAALRIPHVNNQDGDEIDFEAESKKYLDGDKAGSKVMRFANDFMSKDMMVVGVYLVFFFYLVFYNYGFAMDPVNFDPADGLKTPAHIYPEWYFLWSYEILRPFNIDLGLALFGFAQVIFVFLPFLDRSPNSVPASRRGAFKYWFWGMLIVMIVLTAMGKLPPEGMFSTIGLVAAIIFIAMWIALPIITSLEKKL